MSELVTIIVASYNYEKFLPQTLNSLLAQSHSMWDAIVVDDGSNDSSVSIIREFSNLDSRIQLMQHPEGMNMGLSSSIQLALSCAKGEWIAFCESDDWWDPLFLETVLKRVSEDQSAGLIFTDVILEGTSPSMEIHCDIIRTHFRNGGGAMELYRKMCNAVSTFSCTIVKSDLIKSCNFDAHFAPSLDMWLWSQLVNMTNFSYVDKPLAHWRQHDSSYMKKAIEPGTLEMETVLEFHSRMRRLFDQERSIGASSEFRRQSSSLTKNRNDLSGRFDVDFYRRKYPDLHGMSEEQLIDHYLSYGKSEGRLAWDCEANNAPTK